MTAFRGLRSMSVVLALAAHSLAAPTVKLAAAATVKSAEDQTAAQTVRDTLIELTTALVMGDVGGGLTGSSNARKTEMHHSGGHGHKPHHHHQAISNLIHLLLTIGSAFAPLVGAIVGPLLTNIANGITWAISHTIASGFSPPHGLFSPELGHGSNHANEHPTSYAVQGQSETGSDAFQVQQPVDVATVQQAEPTTVDDTIVETK